MREDRDLLAAMLRTDFLSLWMRCFHTLNPGEPFLPNWTSQCHSILS